MAAFPHPKAARAASESSRQRGGRSRPLVPGSTLRGRSGRALHWLAGTALRDPFERRHAPLLQLIFLWFALYLPANLIYVRCTRSGAPAPAFEQWLVDRADGVTDLCLAAAAGLGLYLVRIGRLRQALVTFLAILLGSLAVMAVLQRATAVMIDPTFPVLALVLGGLLLGRAALWKILASLLAILLLQMQDISSLWTTARAHPDTPDLVLHFATLFLVITAVLDRTLVALRDSMATSRRQSESLARANALLREEMLQRERAHEQLIHAQKMEAVGRIASGVAHDFDNVLNVILGFAARRQRLAAHGGIDALLEALEGIEHAGRRAAAISRKLLNFSRQQASAPVRFDAIGALRESRPMLEQLLDGEGLLELELASTPVPIMMDRDQFELMLLNIVANSKDALCGNDHGRVHIGAAYAPGCQALSLTIADNGTGIPDQVRSRIFEPFFTTKSAGLGTGLGLTVVQDLVVALQGTVAIDCPPTGGTRVRIVLPAASGPVVDEEIPRTP